MLVGVITVPMTGAVTPLTGGLLAPRLGLATTSTVDDSGGTAPSQSTRSIYEDAAAGISPVLGLATATVEDPTGQALTTRIGYEPLGTGYLRRVSRTMPSGAITTTSNYGGSESRTNPCPAGGSAVQSGLPKQTTGPGGLTSETVYDVWGRVVASGSSRNGATPSAWSCTEFDPRGRVTKTIDPSGRTTSSVWAVDPDTGGPVNPDPLTSTVSDPAGTITTVVDLLGRQVSYTDTLGTLTTTEYNTVGLVAKTVSTPVGFPARAVEYTYDAAGRLTTQKAATLSVATVTYTPGGELDTVSYPAYTASLAVTGRDGAGRTTAQSWTLPAGVHTDTRTLSKAGRTLTAAWTAPTGLEGSRSYGYDTAGRLTTADVSRSTTGSGTVAHGYSYSYATSDPTCTGVSGSVGNAGVNGNRTRISDTIAGSTTSQVFCHDAADRLLKASGGPWGSGVSPTYDDRGNTLTIGGQSFAWDAGDRSVGAASGSTTVTWARDAAGRVASRTTGVTSSRYSYTGPGDAPGWILAGTQAYQQVPLPGGPVAQLLGTSNGRQLAIPDLHGDVILTLDYLGAALSPVAVYNPDGQPLSSVNGLLDTDATPDTSFGSSDNAYVGQHQKQYEHAGDLALVQMGARPYHPALARFLAVDPVEGGTSNDYTYPDDPVNDYDLNGMWSWRSVGSTLWKYKWDIALTAAAFVVPAAGAAVWAYRAYRIVKTARAVEGFSGGIKASRATSWLAGRMWTGAGSRATSVGGRMSADGLRQWRPPVYKPKWQAYQSNFESRSMPRGRWTNNYHVMH